jgi:L-serine deaminase
VRAGDAQTGTVSVEVVREGIDRIWAAMRDCVARGIAAEGILPGGLNVRRRAHHLAARLAEKEATVCAAIRWRRSTGLPCTPWR